MLRRRPSAEIDVVCLGDPALDEVPAEKMQRYQISRDTADLGDLDKLTEKPTVFRVRPLAQKYERVADDPDSDDMWFIFARHVTGVRGFGDERGKEMNLPMEDVRGELVVADEAREQIGREAINEVAAVIIQRANGRDGDTLPFITGQATWPRDRIQRRTLLALRGEDRDAGNAPTTDTA